MPSAASQSDVLHAADQGREVCLSIGLDASGQPTTSPRAILDGDALRPFGGPKGAFLAVMVEVLAAALTGGPFGFEGCAPAGSATISLRGQFLMVIDPARSAPDFMDRMAVLGRALAEAGSERLPGDRRYAARRQSRADGIPVDPASCAKLLELAGERAA